MPVTKVPDAIQHLAVTETYQDVQKLLYKVAHKHAELFELPFKDVLSVGHDLFMYCYSMWEPTRVASFSTYFQFVLDRQLLTRLAREKNYRNYYEINEEIAGCDSDYTYLFELKEELSEDACHILQLIFDTPSDLTLELKWSEVRTSGRYLKTITKYLENEEWPVERVEWAFAEIQRHLSPTSTYKKSRIIRYEDY